jgi:hypothetical protein
MNLKEYKIALNKHDWYYGMSDDPRVFNAGYAEEVRLEKLAESRKTYKKAFEAKKEKIFPSKKPKSNEKTTNYDSYTKSLG